jgi:hypothetical protein
MFRRFERALYWSLLTTVILALPQRSHATVCTIGPAGNLPPQCFGGGGYLSPNDVHHIIDGLPPGSAIDIGVEHLDFFNIVRIPDGLGGEIETFQSAFLMHLQGTGAFAGYNSFKSMQMTDQVQVSADTHANPGIRSHASNYLGIQGQLPPGDPDFDLLRITAGNSFGMPSPGHTTLHQLPGGNWNVDSFFDITYRIDFVGRAGGPFGGMSGSTTGTIRMQIGEPFVPEPTTFGLLGLGVFGLAFRRHRQ